MDKISSLEFKNEVCTPVISYLKVAILSFPTRNAITFETSICITIRNTNTLVFTQASLKIFFIILRFKFMVINDNFQNSFK